MRKVVVCCGIGFAVRTVEGGGRDGGGPLMTLVIQINISLELNSNNKNITVWNIGMQQLTYADLSNLFIKPNSPSIFN